MGTAAKQLQQLNEEIAALSPEIKAAREAYNIKAAATTRVAVDLAGASSDKALQVLHDRAQKEERQALGFYEDLKKDKERLLGAREALHAKLLSAGDVFNFESHLWNICNGQSITDYLMHKYSSYYQEARPAEPGYRGRYTARVRSPDEQLRQTVQLRTGKIVPLPLGAQFEIICRQNTIEAALYYFARIERAWMEGSGDNAFRRSTVLMSLIGAPGCGKTTVLLELIPRMRAYMEQYPAQVLELVQAAASGCTHEQHEAILGRLRASVQEGRELICWLRLNDDPELLDLELGDSQRRLALRVLYGFLTYLDDLEVPSPVGTYGAFLSAMDADVRQRLSPEHVYEFVERLTGTGGAQHCFFLLLDEFNAVKSDGEGDKATWAQDLMSAHIRWLSQQPRGDRLVVPVLGTTRHTDASLSGTASKQARTAVLPLCVPLLSDMQRLVHSVLRRLPQDKVVVPEQPSWSPGSAMTLLLCLMGGNFRLLHYGLSMLGGAKSHDKAKEWGAETLALSLVDSTSKEWTEDISRVLKQLSQCMAEQQWVRRIAAASHPEKWAVITQAIAYALVGECVRLADTVVGSGGIKWGTLMNEGLILALYAGDDDTGGPAGGKQHRTSLSLSPRATPADSSPDLKVTIYEPEPMAVDDAEEATTPPAAAISSVSHSSPVLHTATPIGYRRSVSPAPDPSLVDVTVQLCPMVMSVVWPSLDLPMLAPVAGLECDESSNRKEKLSTPLSRSLHDADKSDVDLGSLLFPLLLRRRFLGHLGKEVLSLKSVLRCNWIPPNLAGVKVILPPESKALGVIGCIRHKLYPEPFDRAVAAGHAALDLTAEPDGASALDRAEAARRLAQSSRVAYAFTGASNHGVDTFMILKTAQPVGEHLLILLQSKQSASMGTHTLDYALKEMGKDLESSGICVEGLQHVQALECLPETRGATKAMKSGSETWAIREARYSESAGGFLDGSMEDFEKATQDATEQQLDHWAHQLRQRGITQPKSSKDPLVYMFVTDLRMTKAQHARHEVLALAGHKLASRLVLVDQDQHDSFYGIANALMRRLGKAVNT